MSAMNTSTKEKKQKASLRQRAARILKRHRIKNYPFESNASNERFCVYRAIEGEPYLALKMLVEIQHLQWKGLCTYGDRDKLERLVAYFDSFDQRRINDRGMWDLNTWSEVVPPDSGEPASIGSIETKRISARLRHILQAAQITSKEGLQQALADNGRQFLKYRNAGQKTLKEAMELAGMAGEFYCKCCGQSLLGARARDGAERVAGKPRLGVEDDAPPGLADLIAQNLEE
jgi:hypothetical protein